MGNGKIVLVTSGKGGSGKSTFSVNCATALASIGRKVVLVDADIGLRSLDLMLGISERVIYDISDVLQGRCETGKAIIVSDYHNLHLLPASQNECDELKDAKVITKLYKGLSLYYDYVFIDCSAGISKIVTAPSTVADISVVVATPDSVCIRDAERMSQILRQNGQNNIRLILNRIQPKLIRKKVIPNLDSFIDASSVQLLGIVPEDKHIVMSQAKGKSVMIFRCDASTAFKNIARRLDGEDIPLMSL